MRAREKERTLAKERFKSNSKKRGKQTKIQRENKKGLG